MGNLLVNTALVVALAVGSGLLGMGVGKVINTAPVTKEVVTAALPTIDTSKSIDVSKKTIKQLDLTDKKVLTLYGVVGDESYALAKAITDLGRSGEPIYLLINSPGGSVLDGALIVSAIEGSRVPVYTICEQLCASMLFIIHQYGTKRLMVDRAILMAHPAAGGVEGTLQQMQSRLGTISRYVDKFDAQIAKRAGLTLDQFKPMTVSEMWIDAEDATARKFNDEIVNVRLAAIPAADLSLLNSRKKQNNVAKEKVNIRW